MPAETLDPSLIASIAQPRDVIACAHCAEPVPAGLIDRDVFEQFCCHGCRSVFRLIHSCELDRYYRLREQAGEQPKPVQATGKRYAEYDDPAFATMYVRFIDDRFRSCDLFLQNVHCAACVWLVEKLPKVLPGVIEARLDLRRALVHLTWDHAAVALSQIAHTLDTLGYPPHPPPGARGEQSALRTLEDRQHLIRLGIAGACAGNVMLLALALYAGAFNSVEGSYATFFRWLSMGLSVLSLAWPGRVFFKGAWAAIRTRTLHLDLPIAIGLGAGAIWGVVNTIRGSGEIYFDSLSVLVFALLLGRWIQRRQQRWSSDSVELLYSLTPTSARLVKDDGVREVPIETIAIDEVVEVLAGDSVPVDGLILSGHSSVDQSLLTGESRPVEVGPGDAVHAGAVNVASTLRIKVSATGEDTRVGKLMRMVEECAQRRAPIVKLADRISGWFVAAMLGLAALTFLVWLWLDPSRAIDHAVALLIVTCPCALGLATPLAVTVAIGRAARMGILIKGGDALQNLSTPGTIFLDKTGTITQGRMSLIEWHGDEQCKPLVASVEWQCTHPIGRALVEGLAVRGDQRVATVRQEIGGVCGWVDDHHLLIGSVGYVNSRANRHERIDHEVEAMVGRGLTPILIAVDGRVVAAAGLGDAVRADARHAIDSMRQMGWRVGMLSGDHPQLVASVGAALELSAVDVHGGMAPEDKLATVQYTRAHFNGPVVMVGDGVNDAAALAAASVGIAVHGGTEASLSAADIYVNRPGLRGLTEVIEGSRRTMRVIRTNLVIALLYNAVAATLAMAGIINPLIAAILMPASSLTVLTLSYQSRTFRNGSARVESAPRNPTCQ